MKLFTTFLLVFLSTFVASKSGSKFGQSFLSGKQKTLGDGTPVPGDNPLTFCKASHDDDLLILERVDLTPNPPLKGSPLSIEVVGELLEDIEQGAYVILQVKYGLLRLVNTQVDLCEQVSNVDLECPISKGSVTITKDVELPNEIPPGTYSVFADAYTFNGTHIVCLEANVQFP